MDRESISKQKIYIQGVLVFFAVFFLSGCEISDEEQKPKIFIPKEYSAASVLEEPEKNMPEKNLESEKTSQNIKKVDGVEYTLIDEKKSPNGSKIWKLYASGDSNCKDKKNLCILEVWEGENKIFFIEEGTPGDIIAMYKSIPQFWISEESLGFIETQNREISTRTLLHSLDIYDGQLSYIWKSVKWNPKNSSEKNTIMTINSRGQSYFLDAISSEEKISLYRVLDPNEEFYVRSGGLKNLKFLAKISLLIEDEVIIMPNPNQIEFSLAGKNYIYEKKKGIIEK